MDVQPSCVQKDSASLGIEKPRLSLLFCCGKFRWSMSHDFNPMMREVVRAEATHCITRLVVWLLFASNAFRVRLMNKKAKLSHQVFGTPSPCLVSSSPWCSVLQLLLISLPITFMKRDIFKRSSPVKPCERIEIHLLVQFAAIYVREVFYPCFGFRGYMAAVSRVYDWKFGRLTSLLQAAACRNRVS